MGSSFYIPRPPLRFAFCAPRSIAIRSSWTAHPRRPQAGRLPARHAHACHAPSGSAAGASRPPLRPPDTRCLAQSPSPTASHPRVGTGNASRPRLRVGPAIPPPTPTPAHGTHCPPFGRFAASAFGASGSAASVSRPIIGFSAECAFPSPPVRFCSSVQRVACPQPAKSTS